MKTRMQPAYKTSLSRFGRKASAAILASALMAGPSFALVVDESNNPYLIDGTVNVTDFTITDNAVMYGNNGSGTDKVETSGIFNLESGTVLNVGLDGTGSVEKNTEGKVTLVGTNSYTGTTTINGGTLQLGDGTVANVLAGTSGITINSGTLALNLSHGADFNKNVTVNEGGTVAFVSGSAMFVSGTITGEGGLSQDGSGTTLLTGTTSYSGQTSVNGGILALWHDDAASANSEFVIGNGQLHVYGTQQIGALSGTGIITSGTNDEIAGPTSLTVGSAASSQFDGVIMGIVRLIKTGNETTLTLTATNEFSYTGGTEINGGVLELKDTGAVVGTIEIVNSNSTLRVDLNDGLTFDNTVVNDGIIDLGPTAGRTNTFASTTSGTGSLIKTGEGTAIVTAPQGYTGVTYIYEGTLVAGVNDAFVTGSALGIIHTGSTQAVFDTAGTTQNVTNLGLIDGIIDDSVGTGSILVSGSTHFVSGTINAVIGGSADLFKTGTSGEEMVLLTAENTYTGETLIDVGTLVIGNGTSGSINDASLVTISGSGALTLNLADGSTFANTVENEGNVNLVQSGTVTVSGPISGIDGSVIQDGEGYSILSGINTYGGVTAVNNGSLEISGYTSANNYVNNDGWLLVSGTTDGLLDIDDSGRGRVSGEVLNDVRVNDDGAFLVTSSGYVSGDVTVNDDAYARVNGEVGSDVIVNDNGLLRVGFGGYVNGDVFVNDAAGARIVGDIGGDLIQNSTGWSVVSYAGDINGDVVINNGLFTLDGEAWQDVIVAHGATINGNGYVNWDLVVNGTVRPGNFDTGELVVGDNYYQGPNSAYVVQIRGKNNYDRITVGGEAHLDGVVAIQKSGYKPKVGERYAILTTGEGTDGKYDGLINPYFDNTLRELGLVYKNGNVYIEYIEQSFLEFAKLASLTDNQKAIAKSLDHNHKKGKIGKLLDNLYETQLPDLPNKLQLLSPEQLTQIYQIGFATAQIQYTNLERRLSDVRDGAIGFSTNGLALSNSRGTLNYDGTPIVNSRDGLSFAGWDGKSVVGKQAVAPVVEQSRWGVFATGNGQWGDVENTSQALGSEFTTGGFTIGADYRVSDNFVVGIAGGYANTSSDLSEGGSIDVNSGRGSVYASLFGSGFYLNTTVGGAYNAYDTKRGTIGGKARGSTEGGEFDALIGGGYDYRVGGLSIGPVASLQYTYLGLSGFQETGSDAPLSYTSQSMDSLKSSLGARVSYAWNVGGVVIKPEVRAQWQHEFLDSTASIESGFVGGAGVFTVNGTDIGRDSLLLDAGASIQFSPAVSVFAYYTGEIGRTNYSSNTVSGGFRINF